MRELLSRAWGLGMPRCASLFASAVLVVLNLPNAFAAGPLGTIHVGPWLGGAYTDDSSGAFSHCSAAQTYGGATLSLAQNSYKAWQLTIADPSLNMPVGANFPIDITFDGQAQFRIFGTATTATLVTAPFPDPAVAQFRKSHLMVTAGKNHTLQFALSATDKLVSVIENCVARMNKGGLAAAGDFSVVPAKATVATTPAAKSATDTSAAPAGPAKPATINGTGFIISAVGHIVTNNHVIKDCVGDVHGNLIGQPEVKLRVVATDGTNDLALLQAAAKKKFKDVATVRDTPVRSGDAVIAIGFPFHGLLTSDFTVTTGIVSSLSGILNDTRFLQISAPVQPGNSGGPLLDMSGHVIGVVAAKIDALKFAKATGNIPENISFAIKIGTVRDFLDNSVVPYATDNSETDLKTAEIASAARAYIMLITCTAGAVGEKPAGKK